MLSRRGLRTPFLRVVQDGRLVEPARFTGSGGVGADVADQVLEDRLLTLLIGAATVVLQGLHRIWPPIIDFAGQLGAELGHPVQVNAYLTPANAKGFAAHYDVHDVFVLQVAGRKRWLVHDPVVAAPLRSQPWADHRPAVERAAAGPPCLDTVLAPGDSLYLPRGYLHSAEALGDLCLHLTVGVQPITRYAVVEALTQLASDEPELRASLPVGVDVSDPGSLADEIATTVRALVKRLDAAEPAEVAARVRGRAWSATRPAPLGPVGQLDAIGRLGQESVVRRRASLRYRLRPGPADTEAMLELPDRTIRLPASTRPAVEMLLTGGPVAVRDLPGLEPAERLVLVRRLLREAVAVPVS